LSVIQNYISQLSQNEQNKIMGGNAARFYKL
jgi:predicted TIM-barrel fold metal-dependent hydrolase